MGGLSEHHLLPFLCWGKAALSAETGGSLMGDSLFLADCHDIDRGPACTLPVPTML